MVYAPEEFDIGIVRVLDRKSIIMHANIDGKSAIVRARIDYGKAFGFRLWLCCRLFRLGAWILGMGIEFTDDKRDSVAVLGG